MDYKLLVIQREYIEGKMEMKKKFENVADYLKQAAIIISQHSLGCSTMETAELKNNRKKYLFSIFDYMLQFLETEDFESIVFTDTNTILYCYSEQSFKQLISSKDDVFLCTSKTQDLGISSVPSKNYKHYYKFKLKENTYGIDINKFLSIFSKNELIRMHDALYNQPKNNYHRVFIREEEEEVIVNARNLILIGEEKF